MTTEERRKMLLEFKELGTGGVRSQLMLRRWPPEKISLARQWLERHDVQQWQKSAPAKEKIGLSAKQRRIIGFVIAGVGVIFAATRIFKAMKMG